MGLGSLLFGTKDGRALPGLRRKEAEAKMILERIEKEAAAGGRDYSDVMYARQAYNAAKLDREDCEARIRNS
ncbi:MAG: hypothetical protein IJ822_00900 [Pyramidobacter sp.]|nr:hypothetical protein [Pyramidobacter sp.]MBR1895321.1 hypothetical protein [Pyramidobacter sp.]